MSQAGTLTPVALYARAAFGHEEDVDAVDAHLDSMREYAEHNKMFPVSHFVDKFGNREEFDWMMAQATSDNPPFRTILQSTHPVSRRTDDPPGGTQGQRAGTLLHHGALSQMLR